MVFEILLGIRGAQVRLEMQLGFRGGAHLQSVAGGQEDTPDHQKTIISLDPMLRQLDATTHLQRLPWEFPIRTCTETCPWRLLDSDVLTCTVRPPLKAEGD